MQIYRETLDLLPVKQRIMEESANRQARVRANLQRERDEYQEAAQIRSEERQADRQEQLQSDKDDMYLRDLERKTDIAGLDNPFRRTTTGTTAVPYSPEQETMRRELRFQEYDTPERIEYLQGILDEEARIRPERVRKEIGRVEGLGEPPEDITTPEGHEAWRKVEKVERTARKKKATELAKDLEEQEAILGNMDTWVKAPEMLDSRGQTVTVDTAQEAYEYFTEEWGYDKDAVRKAVSSVDWPKKRDKWGTSGKIGADEPEAKKETQYEQKQKIKLDNFKFALQRGEYVTEEEGTQLIETQQDAVDVALQEGLNLYDPEVKKAILELPPGEEETGETVPLWWKPKSKEEKITKTVSPYGEKSFKVGQTIEKNGKKYKYLGEGKWEEQ